MTKPSLMFLSLALVIIANMGTPSAWARVSLSDVTKRTAEVQIRNLLEPLLDKYCHDECKLMSITPIVDVRVSDEVAPGFDDTEPGGSLSPVSASARILIDDKVGPISRGKLLELLQQHLDTLDYPVKIETAIAHFPMPRGSEGKVAELRDKTSKQFRTVLEDLFQQFCPGQCLLADFSVSVKPVNGEEAQYGAASEFIQEGGIAIRIADIGGTILVDDRLSPEERNNILEMAKLKTNYLKNVSLNSKAMRFPQPAQMGRGGGYWAGGGGKGFSDKTSSSEKNESRSVANSQSTQDSRFTTNSSNSNQSTNANNTNETNQRQERFERFEKIERVESGDAVQKELEKFKIYGLIFSAAVFALLVFIALATWKAKAGVSVQKLIRSVGSGGSSGFQKGKGDDSANAGDRAGNVAKRYEIERLVEELSGIFAEHPKVAKYVFSRIITEQGVEMMANYIYIFGESIVMDMLRDPSLQSDMGELMEYYAKNPIEIGDDDKLELLQALHARTISGKLAVLGNRSSNLFDFLAEMDGVQILELVRNESLTVKAIVLTQCDNQKRTAIYSQIDEDLRMAILSELSRIDYLPRDYIFNVANALKRKRRENPRLNTEALPGSEVLVSLLERTGSDIQKSVIRNLEMQSPDSARNVKSKLVSIDTLRFLRDGQLLEVILSLRHDELLQFLKGTPDAIRKTIYERSPKELVAELNDEITHVSVLNRDAYQAVERKVLNRIKMMSQAGQINLIETNERMFASGQTNIIEAGPSGINTKKVA